MQNLAQNEKLSAHPEVAAALRDAEEVDFDLCRDNFWHFAEYLVNDDEERGTQRPFPVQFPHLHDVHDICQSENRAAFLKSRRMQISLYFCARMLWRAKFCKQPDVFYGGYSAIDETLALYQLYRIAQMHRRLPKHIQNRNPLVKDNALIKEFENGGKIHGFPLKRIGEQGFGFTEYLFDEAAWQEAAAETYKGLIFSIGNGKIFIVSTPNGQEGTGEFFSDIWHYKNDRYKDFKHRAIHWYECPEHDQKWYDMMASSVQPWEAAQMLELSFVIPAGDAVFGQEFVGKDHVSRETMPIIPEMPIYIGWDFGYHHPAALICQRTTKDQFVPLREFIGQSIDFSIFCKLVREQASAMYDRTTAHEVHCIDPAGLQMYHQKGESGATCDAHEIRNQWSMPGKPAQIRPGAMEVGTRKTEGPRLKEIRRLMHLRDDHRYSLLIDPSCRTLIEGFEGGYAWEKRQGEYSEPIKNLYSHVMDAFGYVVTVYNRMVEPNKFTQPTQAHQRPRIGRRTGR